VTEMDHEPNVEIRRGPGQKIRLVSFEPVRCIRVHIGGKAFHGVSNSYTAPKSIALGRVTAARAARSRLILKSPNIYVARTTLPVPPTRIRLNPRYSVIQSLNEDVFPTHRTFESGDIIPTHRMKPSTCHLIAEHPWRDSPTLDLQLRRATLVTAHQDDDEKQLGLCYSTHSLWWVETYH
jgi:hypothetical protein